MKSRTEGWVALVVVAIGLIPVAILGLRGYMSATATPLHPNPKDSPSVTRTAPLPRWAGAVEQGRQIVRASLTEQNLPGLSVAVGVAGDIVWAEGFGWADLENRVPVAPEMTFRIGTTSTPLGMRDTKADSGREPISNPVTSYFPRFAADPRYGPDPMRPIDYSCYAGSSVFVSTPSDLVRFGMAINSGTLLQPATVQLLQTPQRLTSGQETGYGLGWDLETVPLAGERTRSVGHDGTSLGGTVSSLMTFPERGIVVAVTSNISYADTPAMALKIAQAFAASLH